MGKQYGVWIFGVLGVAGGCATPEVDRGIEELEEHPAVDMTQVSENMETIVAETVSVASAVSHRDEGAWMPFLGRANILFGYETGEVRPDGHEAQRDYYGHLRYHPYDAVDFRLPCNHPIRASGPGEVVLADEETDQTPNAFPRKPGQFVLIEHRRGPISRYSHLNRTFVVEGQRVVRGQVIGLAGRTQSPNVHLHYDEQKTVEDFNLYPNQASIGKMFFRYGGEVRVHDTRSKGTVANWGWSEPVVFVSTARELHAAVAEFNKGTKQGPFIIKPTKDIDLGAQLHYSGDELLIIDGMGGKRTLRSAKNGRVLYADGTGPVEFRDIRLVQRGKHKWKGNLLRSMDSQIIVNRVKFVRSAPGALVYAGEDGRDVVITNKALTECRRY
ncbi:MAG: M23 family metallopeptidase [Myxococcales bacterium]|nr:M23 family metallopeptidase [Myxococcales bacterium]